MKRDITALSIPCSATTITAKELSEGFQMILAADAHLGNKIVGFQLRRFSDVIISVENQQHVVHSTRPYRTIRVSTRSKSTEIINGIPRKPPWLVLVLYKTLRRRKMSGDATHSISSPATTITAEVFSQKKEDTSKLLTANAHSGNVNFHMERSKGGTDGIYFIIDGKKLKKLMMSARFRAAQRVGWVGYGLYPPPYPFTGG